MQEADEPVAQRARTRHGLRPNRLRTLLVTVPTELRATLQHLVRPDLLGIRAEERTAARDSAGPAARGLAARLDELGFADDLAGYLHDRYDRQLRPVLAIAREVGGGNARIQRLLDDAGVQRRSPGAEWP